MLDLNQLLDRLLRLGVVSKSILLSGLVAMLLERINVRGWKYVPVIFFLVGYLISWPLIAAPAKNSFGDVCQTLAARADGFTKTHQGIRLSSAAVFNKETVDCLSRTFVFDTSTTVPRDDITELAPQLEQSMSKSICSVPQVVVFNRNGGKLIVRYNVSDGSPVDLTLAC